jgi:hypothetical protein
MPFGSLAAFMKWCFLAGLECFDVKNRKEVVTTCRAEDFSVALPDCDPPFVFSGMKNLRLLIDQNGVIIIIDSIRNGQVCRNCYFEWSNSEFVAAMS